MPEVEFEIRMLTLRYVFRGFATLHELKKFCDEHASLIDDMGRLAESGDAEVAEDGTIAAAGACLPEPPERPAVVRVDREPFDEPDSVVAEIGPESEDDPKGDPDPPIPDRDAGAVAEVATR